MKIAFLGSRPNFERLTRYLKGQGFEILHVPDIDQFTDLVKQEGCEMVLIDAMDNDFYVACQRAGRLGNVPVVLMIERKQTDWAKLRYLDIHGYIPREARINEVIARLRAIARRCCPNAVANTK